MAFYLLQADGVALSAGAHRRGRAALNGGGSGRAVGGRSGFRVDTSMQVLKVSATAWSLDPCSGMIDPGASTNQGMYGWAVDHTPTGTPTPPDSTLPRKDIYFLQVNDSSSGDGTSGTPTITINYLAGTPDANPVAPALPARSFLLGTATVPQNGGGSPTVVRNPATFVAAGGIQPVYSVAERDGLVAYDGLTVRRMDLPGRPLEVHNGSGWRNGRRHARFTAVAGGGSGSTSGGAEWGFATFTNSTPSTSTNTFASPAAASKIAISEPGIYSVVAKARSTAYPGYYYLSIKNDANNYVYADGNNGSGGDWGATAADPVLEIAAPTNILFGLRTGNSVAADVTVDIFKISD